MKGFGYDGLARSNPHQSVTLKFAFYASHRVGFSHFALKLSDSILH